VEKYQIKKYFCSQFIHPKVIKAKDRQENIELKV